ncbi:MAG: hypothetical protein GQ477_05060 [Nanohaloarchaea archaeon]|nr:hypothetical protein [Candidatus Nanohaloarchaea archaeon]
MHPTEDFRYYLDYLKKKKLNNIVFIKDEPIFNVLNASDLLIHTNTTAATEAWFLGKPTISMVFIKKYKPYFGDQIECSEIVSDYMQLHDKLDYYLEGGKLPNNLKVKIDRFITDWYYKIDGKSTARCVNFIDKFLQQNNTKTRRKINFEVIDMVVKNDLMDYIKSIIYSNKTLRHTFLKIKWKKTKKELDIIDAEYAVSFEDESKNIEEKCKNLLS